MNENDFVNNEEIREEQEATYDIPANGKSPLGKRLLADFIFLAVADIATTVIIKPVGRKLNNYLEQRRLKKAQSKLKVVEHVDEENVIDEKK